MQTRKDNVFQQALCKCLLEDNAGGEKAVNQQNFAPRKIVLNHGCHFARPKEKIKSTVLFCLMGDETRQVRRPGGSVSVRGEKRPELEYKDQHILGSLKPTVTDFMHSRAPLSK